MADYIFRSLLFVKKKTKLLSESVGTVGYSTAHHDYQVVCILLAVKQLAVIEPAFSHSGIGYIWHTQSQISYDITCVPSTESNGMPKQIKAGQKSQAGGTRDGSSSGLHKSDPGGREIRRY